MPMPASEPMPRDAMPRMGAVIFLIVVGTFLGSRILTQLATQEVDSLSDKIAHQSTTRIERLAELRDAALALELATARYLQGGAPGGVSAQSLDAALDKLNYDVSSYLALPPSPATAKSHDELQRARTHLDAAARRVRGLADSGKSAEAWTVFTTETEAAANQLLRAAVDATAESAQDARDSALRIQELRTQTTFYANGLTALCLALALAGAFLLSRQARVQRDLVRAHADELAARAEEFEQFAGRVAHDIRNPLSTARMAAELTLLRAGEEHVKTLAQRITRNLSRADAIVNALLDFARSGAKPDPGARTSPGDVLGDLAKDLSGDAEQARIDLSLEAVPPVAVACSTGVYLSLVGNLVRNAIKYMGDSPRRQIRIRVIDRGTSVRTEVIDTGPGIAEGDRDLLFEPYFRGSSRGREGLGLGLATVRKLAEGHHGSAGVISKRGEGSTFWFELPRAGSASPSVADEEHPSEPLALPH